jgi:hypothetical protein
MQARLLARRSITALSLAWCAHAVHAVTPAIPDNIICGSGNIFTGKVLAVESRDCKLQSPGWCSPRDALVVDVLIDRVLKTVPLPAYLGGKFPVETGGTLKMYVFAFTSGANRYPALLREEEVPVPMTDKWLNERLAGKAFLFAAGGRPWGLSDGPTLLIGNALPVAAVPWVDGVLSSSCGPVGPSRTSGELRPNRSIDTDVLSAGFAGLLSAGHLRRYAARRA